MKTVSIDVKIDRQPDGSYKQVIPTTKRVAETMEDIMELLEADPTTVLDRWNYGEDLFARQQVKQGIAGKGGKQLKQDRAHSRIVELFVAAAMGKPEGDKTFYEQYQEIDETKVKDRQKYLEEFYDNDEWCQGKYENQ